MASKLFLSSFQLILERFECQPRRGLAQVKRVDRVGGAVAQRDETPNRYDHCPHQPQSMMFPGLHPMAMMSTAGMGYSSRGPGLYGSGPAPYPYQSSLPTQQGVAASDTQETTFIYIPNNSVGAIIGTKGSHIRNIIRFSGASVKIAPLEQDKPAEQQTERKVTIVGSPESQWKVNAIVLVIS